MCNFGQTRFDLSVVRAALGTGAHGYVYKMDVPRDFLPAIEAVLLGKQFVSSSLKGYKFTDTAGEKLPHRHEVQFYSDEAVFLDTFAHFIAVALKAGDAAIAVITESHRDGLVLNASSSFHNGEDEHVFQSICAEHSAVYSQ